MENNRFPREVSLCLSGGGARGAFHLGAISVLEENGIKIKAISGTSIGALIGASLACGKTSKEIYDVLKSQEFRNIFQIQLRKTHLLKLNAEAEIINQLIDKNSFEELTTPLSISVCDMTSEQVIHYNAGENFRALVLASCSIVPLFQPVLLDDMLLVDGGVIDNFPVEQLNKYDYPILGVNLYPRFSIKPNSLFGWLKKVIYVAWQVHNTQKEDLCDIYLCSSEISQLSAFSFKDIQKAYELGRNEMKKRV
jgi:NTE family protein